MKLNTKIILLSIVLIIAMIFSPLAVDWYIIELQNWVHNWNSSDLWAYSGAVMTAVIAGGFVIFQVWFENKQQKIQYIHSARPDVEISFERADISNKQGYIFCEDWYINALRKNNKFEQLKDVYLRSSIIPPAFKIECYNNIVTNIVFHYNYESKSGNRYTQDLKVGNVSEGEAKYFITYKMMQNVTNHPMTLDRYEKPIYNTEYIPEHFFDEEVCITFRTIANEKGIIIYKIQKKNLDNLDNNFGNVEDTIIQSYEVYFENDANFPEKYFDEYGKFKSSMSRKNARLVNLNDRLLSNDESKGYINVNKSEWR